MVDKSGYKLNGGMSFFKSGIYIYNLLLFSPENISNLLI